MAKALGRLWGSLTAEEKQIYQKKAAVERERLAVELEAWQAAHGDDAADVVTAATSSSPDSLTLPVARIRKICKLDPDVRGLSKEAVHLISKAAELATTQLGRYAVQTAAMQNRRKLLPDDVVQVCQTREVFGFLKEDLADLKVQMNQQEGGDNALKRKVPSAASAAAVANTKPLTSFFTAKNR